MPLLTAHMTQHVWRAWHDKSIKFIHTTCSWFLSMCSDMCIFAAPCTKRSHLHVLSFNARYMTHTHTHVSQSVPYSVSWGGSAHSSPTGNRLEYLLVITQKPPHAKNSDARAEQLACVYLLASIVQQQSRDTNTRLSDDWIHFCLPHSFRDNNKCPAFTVVGATLK